MAVLIQGFSVVIRRQAIILKFPGKWKSFLAELPNNTLCTDASLTCLAFMNFNDVIAYATFLEKQGLVFSNKGKTVDFAVVDQSSGPTLSTPWLKLDTIFMEGHKVHIGWLGEKFDGRMAFPAHWNPKRVLTPITEEDKDDRIKFLRHEDNLDIFLDLRSGKEIYAGRPLIKGGGEASAFIILERISHEAHKLEAEVTPLKALRDVVGVAAIHERLQNELLPTAHALAEGEAKHMAMAHFVVGLIFRILSRREEAEKALKEAHRLKPDSINTLLELVRCYGEGQRAKDALPFARKGVRVAPMHAGAWGNLAMCLIVCGKNDEARQALHESFLINPQDPINRTIRDNYFPDL